MGASALLDRGPASLLSSPPGKGELADALTALAAKTWIHPRTGEPVRFGVSTIERWYYRAKAERQDPFGVLRRRVRKDLGQQPSMTDGLRQALIVQHAAHKSWSYQLHVDNLAVLVQATPAIGPMPSYSTVVRFMRRTDSRSVVGSGTRSVARPSGPSSASTTARCGASRPSTCTVSGTRTCTSGA